MAVVKVPKTPRSSFDKDRRPSALLLDQITHLEWAALPAAQRKPRQMRRPKVRTEAQAAERIAQLTTMILEAQALPYVPPADGVPKKVKLPPLPKVRRTKPASKNQKKQKRRRKAR